MSKYIFITGSTDGIGKLAAAKLAKDGHHIFIHGRNSTKVESTVSEIISLSKNENVAGYLADLSDLDEVRKLASKIKQDLPKIDVLINNAGVFKSNSSTKYGIDIRLVVNFLAPYLLTRELLQLVEKGNRPRILNLSSAAQAEVSLDAMEGNEKLTDQDAYAQSKLALTMWSMVLANKLKNVNVIAVNPGSLLNTNMVREAYGRHWSSADKGGNILYELAISDTYMDVSGVYFDNDKGSLSSAHPSAYDERKTKDLLLLADSIVNT